MTLPVHTKQIVATGQADAVVPTPEMFRDPYCPLCAPKIPGMDIPWPHHYARAKPKKQKTDEDPAAG